MKISSLNKTHYHSAKTAKKDLKGFSEIETALKKNKALPVEKVKFINRVSKCQILPLSFAVYTLGDILYLFVNNAENNKNNPEIADKLFCQQLATLICNIIVYWASVLVIENAAKSFFGRYVENYKPKHEGRKAAENLSALVALIAGVPVNELFKAVGVAKLTNWFYKHFSSFPSWFLKIFGLYKAAPSAGPDNAFTSSIKYKLA